MRLKIRNYYLPLNLEIEDLYKDLGKTGTLGFCVAEEAAEGEFWFQFQFFRTSDYTLLNMKKGAVVLPVANLKILLDIVENVLRVVEQSSAVHWEVELARYFYSEDHG